MIKSIKLTQKNINWIIYLTLLLLIITFRCLILKHFAFEYTDSDQTIMWFGLEQYSKGIVNEPRFFGQAYNTMIEAFFAIPLYKLGVPAYKALPIITSILTLLPYIFISLFVLLKRSPKVALIIISIPLLLPIEYSLITSLSRGFVTGIFISSFGVLGIFYPKSKASFLFCSLIAVIGYTVNSNAVLISVPCLLYLFLINRKNTHFYIYSSIGLILGAIFHFSINYFYVLHPFYNLHKLDLTYSFSDILLSFNHLDIYFNNVAPIFWKSGFFVLLIFIAISIILFRNKKYNESITVIVTTLVIILTLGISKVNDGSNSVYFSHSRMFLSIPILLGIFLSFFSFNEKSKYYNLYFLIPIYCFIFNFSTINESISQNISQGKNHIISIIKTNELFEQCNNLKTICDEHKIELVIISNHWYYDFFNYGCPSCCKTFPKTLLPSYERRTWRLIEDEKTIYSNILLIDVNKDLTKQFDFIKQINTSNGFFLIKNNLLYTIDLLDTLSIECRKYK